MQQPPKHTMITIGLLARLGYPVLEVIRCDRHVWAEVRQERPKGRMRKVIGHSKAGSLDEALRYIRLQVEAV